MKANASSWCSWSFSLVVCVFHNLFMIKLKVVQTETEIYSIVVFTRMNDNTEQDYQMLQFSVSFVGSALTLVPWKQDDNEDNNEFGTCFGSCLFVLFLFLFCFVY